MTRSFVSFRALIASALSTLCLALSMTDVTYAQYRDWTTGDGTRSDASKWSPNVVPGVTEIARIGNRPSSQRDEVQLDVNTAVTGLQLFDGARLETNGHGFLAIQDTLINDVNNDFTELLIENLSFSTRDLLIQDGNVRLESGVLNVSRLLDNEGNVFRNGTVNLTRNGGVALRNDGQILSGRDSSLTFNQLGTGLMDLDGTSGNGRIAFNHPNYPGMITFNGTQLADSFSGETVTSKSICSI